MTSATAPKPKPPRLMTRKRELVRGTILDAALDLLAREGRADFSMRELAEAAGVSFVTPFNHFGSKDGLLRELMFRRFQGIEAAYRAQPPAGDAVARTLAMARLGVDVMVEQAPVTRAMSVGIISEGSRDVLRRARDLWTLSLGDLDGLDTTWSPDGAALLAEHLALSFRGALVMWIASDLTDGEFRSVVETVVAAHFAAFVGPAQKRDLAALIAARRETSSFG